eukprot:6182380-Pleurochrysis_carterae.AAC.3
MVRSAVQHQWLCRKRLVQDSAGASGQVAGAWCSMPSVSSCRRDRSFAVVQSVPRLVLSSAADSGCALGGQRTHARVRACVRA